MIKVRSPPSNYVINMYSSAKDQLTGSSVAIKKIMKPFSTPVLSKRTYRELKLLKHIQHENVCLLLLFPILRTLVHCYASLDYQPKRRLYFPSGGHVRTLVHNPKILTLVHFLLGTFSPSS